MCAAISQDDSDLWGPSFMEEKSPNASQQVPITTRVAVNATLSNKLEGSSQIVPTIASTARSHGHIRSISHVGVLYTPTSINTLSEGKVL